MFSFFAVSFEYLYACIILIISTACLQDLKAGNTTLNSMQCTKSSGVCYLVLKLMLKH